MNPAVILHQFEFLILKKSVKMTQWVTELRLWHFMLYIRRKVNFYKK